MGRKPNALSLEFFARGAKLNDQSNRYEHTCRRCGEVVGVSPLDDMDMFETTNQFDD